MLWVLCKDVLSIANTFPRSQMDSNQSPCRWFITYPLSKPTLSSKLLRCSLKNLTFWFSSWILNTLSCQPFTFLLSKPCSHPICSFFNLFSPSVSLTCLFQMKYSKWRKRDFPSRIGSESEKSSEMGKNEEKGIDISHFQFETKHVPLNALAQRIPIPFLQKEPSLLKKMSILQREEFLWCCCVTQSDHNLFFRYSQQICFTWTRNLVLREFSWFIHNETFKEDIRISSELLIFRNMFILLYRYIDTWLVERTEQYWKIWMWMWTTTNFLHDQLHFSIFLPLFTALYIAVQVPQSQ